MLIERIDFSNLNIYKSKKLIPVFMEFDNDIYELTINKKNKSEPWMLFQKIFYNKIYNDNKDYIESLLDKCLFSNNVRIFSKTTTIFKNNKAYKFAPNCYVVALTSQHASYNNLIIAKRVINDVKLRNFQLFVVNEEEMDNPNLQKELKKFVKEEFYPKSKIKNGNFVVGHINSVVLNDKEKFIKYVNNEFKNKVLIGDIVINEDQEKLLNDYMTVQLHNFITNCVSFTPESKPLFALGLVRYAMHNYNKKKGTFWPYFKNDYGVEISTNKQKFIIDLFKGIANKYKKAYIDDTPQKVDNITMHSFVADNSAFQLFDYIFDFWRIDLERNVENLNDNSLFNELIEAMKNGTQDVMKHTSLLLNFPKTITIFKNRIKRIIRLINDAFWNNSQINETGNRINHLLNNWINLENGSFQKEKKYVQMHTTKEKGEILYRVPTLTINNATEALKIILPQQRLINCTTDDSPVWVIKNNDSEIARIDVSYHFKHDKIGCYIEKMYYEIPLNSILDEFKIELYSNEKLLKKYQISKSSTRLFDSNGKNIDYNTSNIPSGVVTAYSNNESYPEVLGMNNKAIKIDTLFMKIFNLVNGQIMVLDKGYGFQVGQKLSEGLNETYPINGAKLVHENQKYDIYNALPKLLFKASKDELKGISLIINDKQNKITDKPLKEFKIASELNELGYIIDLNDYSLSEGIYQIVLSYPNRHVKHEIGKIAYIKQFNYEFINAPYIFKETAEISFRKELNICKDTNSSDGEWNESTQTFSYFFNFSENKQRCELVKDRKLELMYIINENRYSIFFDIPALFWKFSVNDEWNVNQPANILLKNLKNKFQKLYVSGPFDFTKAIIKTTSDVEIADEESEIKAISSNANYFFEISKAYNWFSSDRSEVYRKIFITLNGNDIPLLNVICKSQLKDVSLLGDFNNNLLIGDVDIIGNESYTISIFHNGKSICEDEPIIDNHFKIETELESGNYEIYVYEVSSDDEDGFGFDEELILLNKKPIIKQLIDLSNLEKYQINLIGYQDINKKYVCNNFLRKYIIKDLKKIKYADLENEDEEVDIYGIWNDSIDSCNYEQMNNFIYYVGTLNYYSKYDYSLKEMTNVVIIFTNAMQTESIIILEKENDSGCFGSLQIDKSRKIIIPYEQFIRLDKFNKKNCSCFYDDLFYYIVKIEGDN